MAESAVSLTLQYLPLPRPSPTTAFPVSHRHLDPGIPLIASLQVLTDGEYRFRGTVEAGMTDTEYDEFLTRKRRQLSGEGALMWKKPCIAWTADGELVGGVAELLAWAKENHGYTDATLPTLYNNMARKAYLAWRESTGHQFAFLEFEQGEGEQASKLGRVVIELYTDLCPKACENFVALASGGARGSKKTATYLGTPVHRVVKGGWIQAGDTQGGHGTGGECIWGGTFADECYHLEHDTVGILGMANKGRHTNGSQFYLTLKALPPFNRKFMAFGRVIEGMRTLRVIDKLETENERPHDVRITGCGLDIQAK